METTTVLTQGPFVKNGQNDKGPWTLTSFKDSSGTEFSTFKGDLASAATALLGQTVKVEYDEKQNGKYTNRTLTSIALQVGAATPANGAVEVFGTPPPAPVSNDRELRIMRQSGLDRALTAFGIIGEDPIGRQDDLFELSDSYIDYFENGRSA